MAAWLRDVLKFPSRQFEIDTELSQAEVVERLSGIVEPGGVFLASFSRTNKLFAGEVSPDRFKIMRPIYYGNSGLPVVEGHFQPGIKGTRVEVTMRMMQSTRIVSMVVFGFLAFLITVVLLAGIFSSKEPEVGTTSAMLGIAVAMGLFAYLIWAVPFALEARKARGLLEEALKTTPGPRIQQVLQSAPPRLSRLAKFVIVVGVGSVLASMVSMVAAHLMVGSKPYQIAESFIRSNPVVQEDLGRVLGLKLELTGNGVSYAGPEGNARFAFDVQGARGDGIVLVEMQRHRGVWRVSAANLREADGRVIQLQGDAASESAVPGR